MIYNPFFPWKALTFTTQIQGIIAGEFLSPVIAHVYPTNICNRDCEWCIMAKERQSGATLPAEIFSKLIDDLNTAKVPALHIVGGGEPTLYPHIGLVEKFNGFKTISTNGIELTREVASLFDRVRISVDAGTCTTYQMISRVKPGVWAKLWGSIQEVTRGKRPYQVGLAMVVNAQNWHEIPLFVRNAQGVKADFVHIRPAYYPKGTSQGDEVERLAPAMTTISRAASIAYPGVPVHTVADKFEGFWTEKQYSKCLATPLQAVICADGQLSICLDNHIKFGDLNKHRFPNIWGGPEHKRAIEQVNLDECPRCVLGKANEVIEHVFIKNEVIRELI